MGGEEFHDHPTSTCAGNRCGRRLLILAAATGTAADPVREDSGRFDYERKSSWPATVAHNRALIAADGAVPDETDTRWLWGRVKTDFPSQCGRWGSEFQNGKHLVRWLQDPNSTKYERSIVQKSLRFLEPFADRFQARFDELAEAHAAGRDTGWLALYEEMCGFRRYVGLYRSMDVVALRRAVNDLRAEWTRSVYMPYPYADDGRNETDTVQRRVVRGGSWRDRPTRASSSYRLPYQPYQKVLNVGFRVVVED